MSDTQRVRVGIIGIGNIGSAHASAIYGGKVPQMQLTAVCDTDESVRDAVAQKYDGVRVFSNHTDLIESGLVDAVIVATPHYFHCPIAIDAFRKDLHVLTEKPAGVDCASVKQMCDEAKKSGKVFGVMFNQRANKLFGEAKRIMSSGELGEFRRMVWIITNWYRKQAYYDSGSWRATWSGEGGGVLLNQAPHNLDLWQWICGMPKTVRAECYVAKHHDIEVEDDAILFAEYENGATATFITTTGDYPGTNRLEITGSKGKIVIEKGSLTKYTLQMDESEYRKTDADVKNRVEVSVIEDEPYNGHCVILNNFADAVLNGTPLLASGYEALGELELSNAAYLSAWQDKKISIPVCDEDFLKLLEQRKQNSSFHAQHSELKENDSYFSRWNTNW